MVSSAEGRRAGAPRGSIGSRRAGLVGGLAASLVGFAGLGLMLASPERVLSWSFSQQLATKASDWAAASGSVALDTIERPVLAHAIELTHGDSQVAERATVRRLAPRRAIATGDQFRIAPPGGPAIVLEVTHVKPLAAGSIGIDGKPIDAAMLLIIARNLDQPDAAPVRFLMDALTPPTGAATKS